MPQANFTDPALAAGVGNIMEALFGNPEKAARHRVNTLQGDRLQQTVSGRQQLYDNLRAFQPGSDMSSEMAANAMLGDQGGDIASVLLALNANNMGVGDDRVIRSLAGTGRTIGPNAAVSLGGQGAIRGDNERIGDERVGMQQAGAMDRVLAQIDARQPTKSAVQGDILQQLFDDPTLRSEEAMRLGGAASTGSGASVPKVSFNDVYRIDDLIDTMFEDKVVDEGVKEAVRQRTSEIFQQTGNGPLALQQAVSALTETGTEDNWIFPNNPTVSLKPAPPGAIEMLRADPSLAQAFDEKYGVGAAAAVLNGG